jgi:predicted nucleotidyltransferase component of viral defense system
MNDKKQIKNIPASVRARLLNIARQNKASFDNILLQYFQERFLYRLSISKYKDNFILKGGLLFLAYNIPLLRPTKDMDLLGKFISMDFDNIQGIIQDIIKIQVPDGITFLSETITVEKIKKEQTYEGVKVIFEAELDKAKKILQIDIGFGDKVIPAPLKVNFPVLLDNPVPNIRVYSRESAIAEKFEAMVKLGIANSRMKDFYDILFMASSQTFKSKSLHKAIYATFKHRDTSLEKRKTIFAEEFKKHIEKQKLWTLFLQRNKLSSSLSIDFADVVNQIGTFLEPVCTEEITRVPEKFWKNELWKWIEKT